MKVLLALIVLVAANVSAYAKDVYVHGYTRSNGTHVSSYHRSSPDNNPYNNYGYNGY